MILVFGLIGLCQDVDGRKGHEEAALHAERKVGHKAIWHPDEHVIGREDATLYPPEQVATLRAMRGLFQICLFGPGDLHGRRSA